MSMHFQGCSCRVCQVCSFANASIDLDKRICQATLHVAHGRPAFWCTSSPAPTGVVDEVIVRALPAHDMAAESLAIMHAVKPS